MAEVITCPHCGRMESWRPEDGARTHCSFCNGMIAGAAVVSAGTTTTPDYPDKYPWIWLIRVAIFAIAVAVVSIIVINYTYLAPRYRHDLAVKRLQALGALQEPLEYGNVEDINLRGVRLTDEDLRIIVHFNYIRILDVRGTGISEEQRRWLVTSLNPYGDATRPYRPVFSD
jgi:hypothetical protein